MTAPTISQALAEAYAYAAPNTLVLHTLEMRHPAFVTESGAPDAVRVVLDHDDHVLTLEADAPLHGGLQVAFKGFAFTVGLPEQAAGRLPEMEISVDNVTREIADRLGQAIAVRAPIELTYREYLAADTSQPHRVMSGFTLREAIATIYRVTGRAGFLDFVNRTFPGLRYTREGFPLLAR
ncbi:DUF1833 family protein [Inquilinus sp. NPDC058860]|uniref:DUF1833 family protein n=1 Tax=Inquilinus sp. NPDC058860 TaxID=3346652 RepID=UPI0036A8F1C1